MDAKSVKLNYPGTLMKFIGKVHIINDARHSAEMSIINVHWNSKFLVRTMDKKWSVSQRRLANISLRK